MLFDNIKKFFKKTNKKESSNINSKDAAKERLHLVLMQDRANVSADFLDLMRQEIIEVIKKYIDVDESAIDVRLTNQSNEDGTQGAPALYANIPIVNIKEESKKIKKDNLKQLSIEDIKIEEKSAHQDAKKAENKKEEDAPKDKNEVEEEKIDLKEEVEHKEENDEVKKEEIVNKEDIKTDNSEIEKEESEEQIPEEEMKKIEEAKKIVEEEKKNTEEKTEENAN